MAKLDESTLEAVNNANYKAVGESSALLQNLANANAISHQKRMDALTEVSFSESVRRMQSANDELAEKGVSGSLAAAVAQILLKGAQTTPPVTA